MFAKINKNILIKFPYDMLDLTKENPHTNFDNRFDLIEWYSYTEESRSTGNTIVKVEKLLSPSYDPATQRLIFNETPTLLDERWVQTWNIVDLSPEEISAAKRLLVMSDNTAVATTFASSTTSTAM